MFPLTKSHPMYVFVLRNLEQIIITRSIHQRMPPIKEVVKYI